MLRLAPRPVRRSEPPSQPDEGPLRAYEEAFDAASRGDDLGLERLRRRARACRRSTENINRAVVDAARARLLGE